MVSVVAAPVAVAQAFSPGHITGFVIKPKTNFGYLYHGSTGAGFSISRGITTIVEVFESFKTGYQILINGIESLDADVSRWVTEKYLTLVDRPYHIKIKHIVDIPIGYGLGSSGAAALSLSYALNAALDTGLGKKQAAQIAHHAEIACNTGLGTVIAEYSGGFEIRTKIGAPGIGSIENIKISDHRAIILCISPISTKSFLANMDFNGRAEKMLDRLQKTKSIDDFLKMSGEFAKTVGLAEGKCSKPIQKLRANGFDCGVALFGHTVFTIVPQSQSKKVVEIMKDFEGILIECDIDNFGARVL